MFLWGGEGGFLWGGEGVFKDFQEPAFFVVDFFFFFRFLLKQPIFTRTKLSLSVNYWTKVGPGTGI